MNRLLFVPLPFVFGVSLAATLPLEARAQPMPRPSAAAGDPGTVQVVSAALGDTLVLEADDAPRIDAPASVVLNVPPAELPKVRLWEIADDKKRHVPAQVEQGDPPRLWWIARGELPARSKRTYRLEAGEATDDVGVLVDRRADSVVLRVGETQVLQYNMAHVAPPEGLDARYGRSAYIHPCWTPAGAIVTDQFPPDHAHQSGLFLAHTKTVFEGRTPNFWDLLGGTGRVRFKQLRSTSGGPVFGDLEVVHEHLDLSALPAKVALVEHWQVRVWNLGGREAKYWVSDITSTIACATSSPLRLSEYHYGGMALRGARTWDAGTARVVTAEGKDRLAGNHSRPRWCDLSGPVGDRSAGITFFTHPENFRAPEPLRIHPTMPYMVYAPSQLGEWEISPGRPHVSRYRFVFHDGDMPAATADRLWRNFAEPLTPKLTQAARADK